MPPLSAPAVPTGRAAQPDFHPRPCRCPVLSVPLITPGGVVPLRLCVTRRLTCSRCLPFLLASQTALTPPVDPLGQPGLHHAHLPLLHGRAMASPAGRVAAPPADPPACDARRRQRAGTVQVLSVRPRNETECSSDLWFAPVHRPIGHVAGTARPAEMVGLGVVLSVKTPGLEASGDRQPGGPSRPP